MSTTPVDPRVVDVMHMTLRDVFGNPASQHAVGAHARRLVETARVQVAELINADSKDIIFTSGATESINLALKGAALFYQRQGRHIITMSTEHNAVLDTCRYLESTGFEVTYLMPQKNGLLDLGQLRSAIRPDTILASIMHVNNETGVIQDIAAIGHILREKGVWFHVDAAQSIGKISVDIKALPVDLLSLSSHKIYGPKGIGALYVRRQPRVQLMPLLHGGEQENTLRSGTIATHQVVGMGEAYVIAKNNIHTEPARIAALRDALWNKLLAIPGIHRNAVVPSYPVPPLVCGCLNFYIENINTAHFLKNLTDVALSQGSACNAVDPEPSHVLMAMGLTRAQANASFRVSVGRFTTPDDVEKAAHILIKTASS